MSETDAVADVERLKRQAERWESRARLASAASHSRAVIDQADNDTLRAELAELRVKWEQECANLEMAERRAEAAEGEVERLTRECLDREATETDARERLRQAEAKLEKVEELRRRWKAVNPSGAFPETGAWAHWAADNLQKALGD